MGKGFSSMKWHLMVPVIIVLLLIPRPFTSLDSENENVVLLTGFEPFNGYDVNPSQMVAEKLNGKKIGNATVIAIVLPVDFDGSAEIVKKAVEKFEPVAVINMGLNGYARKIEVEKIAFNVRSVYVDGKWRGWKRIDDKGSPFFFSTLPVNSIVEKIKENGSKAGISYFAGTYSCNYVFYSTLLYLNQENLSIPSGFIHLPPLKYQKRYGMELEEMVEDIRIAIEETLEETEWINNGI